MKAIRKAISARGWSANILLRMWCTVLATLMLAGTARAWQPVGWVYMDWPWAYDSTSEDWHWFSAGGTPWIYENSPGVGWSLLQASSLAQGWSYWNGEWGYDADNDAWCWRNTGDTQLSVNMRTGTWSRFGEPVGMVLIPGGTNAGMNPDPGLGAYSLTVSPFYMDQYEVTKAQWDEVYAWGINHGYSFDNAGSGKAADHPVQSVNWYDVVKWCNARSQMEGRSPAYWSSGSVYKTGQANSVVLFVPTSYRLPTETEWEYAARGGAMNRRFPWGDSDTIQHTRANYISDAAYAYDTSLTRGYNLMYTTAVSPHTNPVGLFAPNGYGLYDMAGNVFEWCFTSAGTARVFRGGSGDFKALGCLLGASYTSERDAVLYDLGFRAVLAPSP